MLEPWPLSADEIVDMPIDALGLAILRDVQANREWHQGNWILKAVQSSHYQGRQDALRALEEGWAWLRSRVLVAHDPSQSTDGAIFVTRRGLVALRDGLAQTRAEERLELDLHPEIAERVRSQFILGEQELAVFAAFRSVEERVRRLSGATESDLGVDLMHQSFRKGGPLQAPASDKGEIVARMELFAGAIGVFKNPSSHRTVNYADVTAASEAVIFADLLHRLLDEYETDRNAPS